MEEKGILFPAESKILDEFQRLRQQYKGSQKSIVDKQTELVQQEKQAIVETASKYTAENIVKGLANLQLAFSKTIDEISQKVQDESSKLSTLKMAIQIEQNNLLHLKNIKTAADALNVFTQNHKMELEKLEAESQQQSQIIESEISVTKLKWKDEQKEHEANLKEQNLLQAKDRKKKEADYQYSIERKRKIELDELATKKQMLEHEPLEKNQELVEDWQIREERLEQQGTLIEELKKKVATFPKEIDQAVNTAKEILIQELQEDAKIKAELFEKEVEADNKLFLIKIKTLEETVQNQQKQVEELTKQLQAVLKENQNMANKTVESSKKNAPRKTGEND